jgi:Flp pilus assembly protein TadB
MTQIHFIMWYFLFCPFYHVVFLVLFILSCGIINILPLIESVMVDYHTQKTNITNKRYHMTQWTKQEIPYTKMDKTRNTTWQNEQNKKYHIIKWTKQEIPHDTMNITYYVVFLVLSILLYGISCFVHCVMWYFLFSSFYYVVFLVLYTTWHNEQNKKYHILKWTKQEIPHDKMNKTRNTT